MSARDTYDALTYTVDLRLNDLNAQQQRATTLAAADGVLLGVVASTSTGAAGPTRTLVLIALVMLSLGLAAAAVAIWPQTIHQLGSDNPGLDGDDQVVARMTSRLSAVLSSATLSSVRKRRAKAIACQFALAVSALGLLLASAFAS